MGLFDFLKSALNEYSKNINDANSDTSNLSYDELCELREDLRQDTQNQFWRQNLDNMDRKIQIAKQSVMNEIHSMSDEQLDDEINNVWNKYQDDDKVFSKDKRLYEEKWKDDSYKQHERDYRYFDNLKTEKQHRYADSHPEEFPKHREHGFNLYKEDDK